jgi:hypothetical protein
MMGAPTAIPTGANNGTNNPTFKRLESCFFQKEHCVHTHQGLIFDDKNQWNRHGNNGTLVKFSDARASRGRGYQGKRGFPISRSALGHYHFLGSARVKAAAGISCPGCGTRYLPGRPHLEGLLSDKGASRRCWPRFAGSGNGGAGFAHVAK